MSGADDETADGSDFKPYKSLAYAYIQNYEKPTPEYLTRASVNRLDLDRPAPEQTRVSVNRQPAGPGPAGCRADAGPPSPRGGPGRRTSRSHPGRSR